MEYFNVYKGDHGIFVSIRVKLENAGYGKESIMLTQNELCPLRTSGMGS